MYILLLSKSEVLKIRFHAVFWSLTFQVNCFHLVAIFVINLTINCTCLLLSHHLSINPLTPNDDYSGRTAPLTSKRSILYIYSTNIGTEYFKHGIYSLFFPVQNAVCFINLTYLVPVLFTFCIQSVLKLKKIVPAPKG